MHFKVGRLCFACIRDRSKGIYRTAFENSNGEWCVIFKGIGVLLIVGGKS